MLKWVVISAILSWNLLHSCYYYACWRLPSYVIAFCVVLRSDCNFASFRSCRFFMNALWFVIVSLICLSSFDLCSLHSSRNAATRELCIALDTFSVSLWMKSTVFFRITSTRWSPHDCNNETTMATAWSNLLAWTDLLLLVLLFVSLSWPSSLPSFLTLRWSPPLKILLLFYVLLTNFCLACTLLVYWSFSLLSSSIDLCNRSLTPWVERGARYIIKSRYYRIFATLPSHYLIWLNSVCSCRR